MADEQLPYLETFARAAELSSFTAAARALDLTQAAVSQHPGHATPTSPWACLPRRRWPEVFGEVEDSGPEDRFAR